MNRLIFTAGFVLAFAGLASAQSDTTSYDADEPMQVEDSYNTDPAAPSEYEMDSDRQEETIYDMDERAMDPSAGEDPDNFGDEVDTTTLEVLTPEDGEPQYEEVNPNNLESTDPNDLDPNGLESDGTGPDRD